MASIESLISNLASTDLSIRLYAILALHDLKSDKAISPALKDAAASETNPTLKLYLNWLANPVTNPGILSAEQLISTLKNPIIEWVSVFYSLHLADRATARTVIGTLRRLDLKKMPPELLPVLVQFYQRFGGDEDIEMLTRWCADPNPVVMSLAIEALSRIQPDRLKGLLLPLLSNQSPGIRSRAIRLLHRWYPEEAPRHLAQMLNSEEIDERRAALANAYFLPFDSIKLELLRFLIKEDSPVLLQQAGYILIINPDPDVARITASIAINAAPEKAPLIRSILEQQHDFLHKSGLIQTAPEESAKQMLNEALQNRLLRQQQASMLPDPDQQAQALRQKILSDPDNSTTLLKTEFRIDLPAPMLQAVVENLATLDPSFLRPHLSELLRSNHLPIQLAALTALARISPVHAEKLLEQYIFSAAVAKRKAGFHVLSLLEKAFAAPLMIKALSREHDPELLTFFAQRLPEPLEKTFIEDMVRQSLQNADTHQIRVALLEELCSRHQVDFPKLTSQDSSSNEFVLENIMVNRATAEALADATNERKTSFALPSIESLKNSAITDQYTSKSPVERLNYILEAAQNSQLSVTELEQIRQIEKDELRLFFIDTVLSKRNLSNHVEFSPIALLQRNFARANPDWHEVAVGLVSVGKGPARLAVPLLQSRNWPAWPGTILPAVINFISLTGQPVFSARVTGLLGHPRPEIRYCASKCLEIINPEELRPFLTELANDRCQEIAALAQGLQKRLDARLAATIMPRRAIKNNNPDEWHDHQLFQLLRIHYRPVLAILGACFFMVILMRPDIKSANTTPPDPEGRYTAKEIERFSAWQKPAVTGEERVVFGRVEKILADSIQVFSPALQKSILIKCEARAFPVKENDHFNARVRIELSDNTLIKAVMLKAKK